MGQGRADKAAHDELAVTGCWAEHWNQEHEQGRTVPLFFMRDNRTAAAATTLNTFFQL